MSEMEQISAQHFGEWVPRPEEGYGQSPAFVPPNDPSELRRWLDARYRDSAELMPAQGHRIMADLRQGARARGSTHRELL